MSNCLIFVCLWFLALFTTWDRIVTKNEKKICFITYSVSCFTILFNEIPGIHLNLTVKLLKIFKAFIKYFFLLYAKMYPQNENDCTWFYLFVLLFKLHTGKTCPLYQAIIQLHYLFIWIFSNQIFLKTFFIRSFHKINQIDISIFNSNTCYCEIPEIGVNASIRLQYDWARPAFVCHISRISLESSFYSMTLTRQYMRIHEITKKCCANWLRCHTL